MQIRSLWYPQARRAELRAAQSLAPSPEHRAYRALTSGISRGTESLVFAGAVPPSEHVRMRAPHMEGEFSFPVKYGYAWVGERIEDGRRVFALLPHQDHAWLRDEDCVPLPAGLPAARASLGANMETALNALWDAELREGMRVSVVGAGVVGSAFAFLCAREFGGSIDLEVVDLDPARADFVDALGYDFATPATASGDRQLVVHASGDPAGLRTALGLCAFEGEVLELSWYGAREVSLPLGGAFHSQRLRLRASQVGAIASSRRGEVGHRQRLALALEALADSRLEALLGEAIPFDELPARLPALFDRAGAHHVVRYDAHGG